MVPAPTNVVPTTPAAEEEVGPFPSIDHVKSTDRHVIRRVQQEDTDDSNDPNRADTRNRSETQEAISQFLSQMLPAEEDIIRSVPAYRALSHFGKPLRQRHRGWHQLSESAGWIDCFWSHSWHNKAWQKVLTLLIIYNALPAMGCATLGALLASGLYAGQILPGWDVELDLTAFRTIWALAVGTLIYLVLLFAGRPSDSVFLDVVCIDQKDRERKNKGLLSMAAFIKRSKSMIVLWDPTYTHRLWCVFELAAFLHSRPHGERPQLIIRPTIFGPTFFFVTIALVLIHFAIMLLQGISDTFVEGAVIFVGSYVNVVTYRQYFRSIETLQQELRAFRVEETSCYCCSVGHEHISLCDKEMLLRCITLWFGSIEVFEQRVQRDVLNNLMEQLSGSFFTYRQCIVALLPVMWCGLDFASGGWLWSKETLKSGEIEWIEERIQEPPHATLANWLIRAVVWWLGAVPCILLLGMKAMYYLRKKRSRWWTDELVNFAIMVWIAGMAMALIQLETTCWQIRFLFPEDLAIRQMWFGMVLFALIVMPVTWLLFTCFGIRSTVALYSAESNVLPTTAQQDVTVVLDISEPSEAGPGS